MEPIKAIFQEVRKRPWIIGLVIVALILLGD